MLHLASRKGLSGALSTRSLLIFRIRSGSASVVMTFLITPVHNDYSPLRILFEFRLYSANDSQYTVVFSSFAWTLLLICPLVGRTPHYPAHPAPICRPLWSLPQLLQAQGHPSSWVTKVPLPITAGVPSLLCYSDLHYFVPNSLTRMLAEFFKGKDHVLYNKVNRCITDIQCCHTH